MKSKFYIILFLIALSVMTPVLHADCSDAYSYFDDAYTYVRRGLNSDSLDDLIYYARKAMLQSEEGMSASSDCQCPNAYSEGEYAYSYSRKAYRASDYEEAIYFLRKAKSAIANAIDAIQSCD